MSYLYLHGFAKDIVDHNCALVVVMTVVLCECLTTLEDEIQYIWRLPWSKTKCTYLFARYFAVAYLITNIVFSMVGPPPLPVSQSKCMAWYLKNMSCFCAQYIASHITLCRRILEGYEVRSVGSALLTFHVAELVGGLVSGKDTLSAARFNGVCDLISVPNDVFVFVGMFLLGQLLMWALILCGFRRRGDKNSPRPNFREMVYRMWHDGEAKIVWAICCMIFLVNTYRGATGQIVKPVYIFVWPICLLSVGTCRYILSMERNADIHTRLSSPNSEGMAHEFNSYDDSNGTEDLPLECYCPGPCEPPACVQSNVSSRPSIMCILYTDNFETLTPDSLRGKHSSCLQDISDSNIKIGDSSSNVSSDLTRRTYTPSAGSSMSTLRRSSISSRMTQETEITAPSIGARSSVDIEIGSLHSSSSATSEELREFWNEVWSGDERGFMHD